MQSVSQSEITANRQMDQIINSLGELPSSPAVINLVLKMTSDFNSDIKALSKALSADQTLTAKILKLSNSSFYGRAQGVATLEEAVMILGFFTLRSLVIATSTHALFKDDIPNSPERQLWVHSLATGIASRIIAQKTPGANVEEAFIGGLMHDIGKLIFLQKMPEMYLEIVNKVESGSSTFSETELESFGFTHSSLGSILMIKWSFPQELIDGVADHHKPEKSCSIESDSSLAAIINLANAMAKSIGADFGQAPPESLTELQSAKFLEIDDEAIVAILAELQDSFEEEKSIFES